MKKYLNLGLGVVVASFVLGCGSSSDDDGIKTHKVDAPAVEVSTSQEVSNALGATVFNSAMNSGIGGVAEIYSASGESVDETSASVLRSMKRATETYECWRGGTETFSGSESDTSINATVTYNQCDEGDGVMNGVLKLNGTNEGGRINLTQTMENYSVNGSDSYTLANLQVVMDATGIEVYDEYYDEYDYAYFDPMKLTLNGTMQMSLYGLNYKMEYENFRVEMLDYSDSTYEFARQRINGKMSQESEEYSCINGSYTFETISDLVPYGNGYSSGTLKVNGATVVFQNNGAAQVTFADGTTETISQDTPISCN